jgi:hypothetical protein
MERRFIDEVTALAADAARLPPRTRTEMRRRMSTESVNHITDQLILHAALFPDHAADCETAAALCTSIAASDEITRISQLAVNGRDLAAENIRGREIGNTLQMLLDAVIDGYTENTRDALLSYLKTRLP